MPGWVVPGDAAEQSIGFSGGAYWVTVRELMEEISRRQTVIKQFACLPKGVSRVHSRLDSQVRD
ncbi:hypothetical protein ACU70A_05730 [Syntrophomonas erecta subsp. sporosyntropha]